MITWLMTIGLATALGGEVRMGQIAYRDIALEELIGSVRSGHTSLALVELARPEQVKRSYPVPGGDGKTCPAYDFIEYRASVRRVVRDGNAQPPLTVGTSIGIVPANVPDLVHLEHRACVEGIRKSPIWPSYQGARPAPGARLLVVLRHVEGYGFVEHVEGAWLPQGDLPKVERLLAAPAEE